MLLRPERELLVSYALRLRGDDLAVGTSGNLSVRSDELVCITPSGIEYEDLTPQLICVLEPDGTPVEAEAPASTEFPMHAAIYRETRAAAVVHTHSPHATALSTVADELPAIHYLIAFLGGPVRVAPYATPGTKELARSAVEHLKGRSAVLLQNHGAITVGDALETAYSRSVLLEWLCALHHRARSLGRPRILSDEELDAVAERLRGYGSWGGARDG